MTDAPNVFLDYEIRRQSRHAHKRKINQSAKTRCPRQSISTLPQEPWPRFLAPEAAGVFGWPAAAAARRRLGGSGSAAAAGRRVWVNKAASSDRR